jgi:rubrerythrin
VVIVDGDADSAQLAAFERDRRELIRRGLAFGGAVVAASSIPLLLSVRNAFAVGDADRTLLADALRLERITVLAYDQLLGRRLLPARVQRLVRQIAGHEREHTRVLTKALIDARLQPPPQPTAKDIDAVVKGIGDVDSQADTLNFAIELETAAVAAYHDAQQKFTDAKLLQTSASIMASEGQHLVLLRQALNQPPVPNAFETGSK